MKLRAQITLLTAQETGFHIIKGLAHASLAFLLVRRIARDYEVAA